MSPAKPQSRGILLGVIFTTLGIFGLLVTGLTLRLRQQLRVEVLEREAEAIHAVALMELNSADSPPRPGEASEGHAALFAAVLESSRLRGVMAVQLFDPRGNLQAALPDTGAESASVRWWALDLARPAARFYSAASLEAIFGAEVEPGAQPTRTAVIEIVVPLHSTSKSPALVGTARYWMDGAAVAAEFSRMDHGLASQAGLAYAGTALLVGGVLAWAFRRLSAQSADLARANQELDFAAKTGAVGAISAHLIHGLKNPLAGLEGFVTDPALQAEGQQGDAWQSAVETTRRLRAMVQEVTTVLRDDAEGRADYPVPLNELIAAVQQRSGPAARSAGVSVDVVGPAEGIVLARTANLAGLILSNLLANAMEASPRGASVRLSTRITGHNVEILVEDQGGGLPENIRAMLFQPVQSAKRNGSGIGLAISRQLARHASGDLELVRSDATGALFSLRIPLMEKKSRGV